MVFKPLRWGVDSLYLSFDGELNADVEKELQKLKQAAQSSEEPEQACAQFALEDHLFEVKDKGSGLFPYVLDDNAFRIQLSRRNKRLPMAYVKVSSAYLSSKRPCDIEDDLLWLLCQVGTNVDPAKVSRIDLYLDFVCDISMESWTRAAWLTRASSVNAYAIDNEFSGWSIGQGGVLSCRLYDKTLELEKSKKYYLQPLWTERGWKAGERVWRLEFQFRREVLTQKGLSELSGMLRHLNGLWSYATTEWLKLTMPNPDDQTRSRWPIHPLWIALASIDWETDGGPLSKRFSPNRAPQDATLCRFAFSALTSFMAREGEFDFWRGWSLLREIVEDHYQQRAEFEGIPFEQLVEEKVRFKGRKFNTLFNPAPVSEEELAEREAEAFEREYRKQSRGGW
ncbi:replication initiation factor [Uliginosibacterium sp. 31-16]|uniref:replication initiation factor n=1 Tax=Uliginosibacterium sp. 31-16 TaxID=3068315 RepID=UPI00273EFB76|nr:replication initiation factor [Uliginosibacterium sp. 31-16]MDP5240883.1 replication initiation factor [Uliginosibacterium sp. 31-16]